MNNDNTVSGTSLGPRTPVTMTVWCGCFWSGGTSPGWRSSSSLSPWTPGSTSTFPGWTSFPSLRSKYRYYKSFIPVPVSQWLGIFLCRMTLACQASSACCGEPKRSHRIFMQIQSGTMDNKMYIFSAGRELSVIIHGSGWRVSPRRWYPAPSSARGCPSAGQIANNTREETIVINTYHIFRAFLHFNYIFCIIYNFKIFQSVWVSFFHGNTVKERKHFRDIQSLICLGVFGCPWLEVNFTCNLYWMEKLHRARQPDGCKKTGAGPNIV